MNTPPDILQKIIKQKRQELIQDKIHKPLEKLQAILSKRTPPLRGFAAQLAARINAGKPGIIAEIKQASPSKGVLRADFDPEQLAISYENGGATCLSVLTDKAFFQGRPSDLLSARNICSLPVLRKDFIIDPYQVYRSRSMGADAILLIVACLDDATLNNLHKLAQELGLDVLVEVHNSLELERALVIEPKILGINNRNLHTFEVNLATTVDLVKQIPKDALENIILVTESGISTAFDIELMHNNGVHSFLIGEAFMKAKNPGRELAELFVQKFT
ncbi:indole-3-glycerol-phosphate synthase [Achromatium sp. WMS3]|nr:indole-3-glycerol-phosphate synthase [Achromatium sp. WMS3]